MTLFAQQGYGKSDKIERGIRDGNLSGVVLSPRDMTPDAMQSYINSLREEFGDEIDILFDPQFYATVISEATDRNLPDYPYYRSGLRRSDFLSAKSVTGFVMNTLEYQADSDLSYVISPTIAFDSFSEPASQTALQLGAEASEHIDDLDSETRLLVSFVIGEAALADVDGIDEFLDIASTWETDGFYLIVEPSGQGYPISMRSEWLANLMYIIHTLATINEYEVHLGYSDFTGLLLSAVGATSQATGWYSGLRQFSRSRWMPSSGGSAARPRYSSEPLMNSILQIPELVASHQVDLLDYCLSDTDYDEPFSSGNPARVAWPPATQCLHHWNVLANLLEDAVAGSIPENLDNMEVLIAEATDRYAELTDAGVVFEHLSGPNHLRTWSEAITAFSDRVSL